MSNPFARKDDNPFGDDSSPYVDNPFAVCAPPGPTPCPSRQGGHHAPPREKNGGPYSKQDAQGLGRMRVLGGGGLTGADGLHKVGRLLAGALGQGGSHCAVQWAVDAPQQGHEEPGEDHGVVERVHDGAHTCPPPPIASQDSNCAHSRDHNVRAENDRSLIWP